MKITSIKAQVKNPERVSIFVDGDYRFSLTHSQLLDQKIRVGLDINETRLQELQKISEFGKMYTRALNYVMIRPRSQREFIDYARRKKWDNSDSLVILEKMLNRGYINDEKFARSWVGNAKINKSISQRKLTLQLRQKGISPTIISNTLENCDFNEQASLQKIIAKKRRLSRYQDDQKLTKYLVTQGFCYSDVKKAIIAEE